MDIRSRAAPILGPVRRNLGFAAKSRRRVRFLRDGIEGICMELRQAIDCGPILREYGAIVGRNDSIHGPLHIMNAPGDFSRLVIGHDVYIGPDVLIDLADSVTIGDYVSIVARTNLITHLDVGEGPLKARRPRKQGPVVIEDGAYLGVAVTVLHGVTIGREATIGAHCLVRKDVAASATYVSPEAKPVWVPRLGPVQ
jgi:acetyltransferase-like isoleucine patch superfamily enzyme